MAVHFKFRSVKDYESIPIDSNFISVYEIKQKIIDIKHLDKWKYFYRKFQNKEFDRKSRVQDFDLIVTNAQTNEEYLDEANPVPKNTSLLIRRVPWPKVPQSVSHQDRPNVEASNPEHVQQQNTNFIEVGSSVMKYSGDLDWNDFGNDVYAIPEPSPVQTSKSIQDVPLPSKDEEDSKIKALVDTPALDWQRQTDGFGPGRGSQRGMSGRMMSGRGFGRGGFEQKTPPSGYVCYRCNQPGHFIQHCPTNGDPEYDVKRVRPPTGIPKSMLMATPDGSYALPNGAVAVLKPNEAAFEKEIEGMPSAHSVGDFPPEFHCPLCKDVMKYAVATKCCYASFCDKCIRDHIITKSICVCDANILADDLVPNKTLRDSINRILELSSNSSTCGNASKIPDVEIKRKHSQIEQNVPSLTNLAASMRNKAPLPQIEESLKVKDAAAESNVNPANKNNKENGETGKVPDVSDGTRDTKTVNEHASQGNALMAGDEVQQIPVSDDAGKKKRKRKKKIQASLNEMQWTNPYDLAMGNYMMPMGPSASNPYWNAMQPGIGGFFPPFGGPMPPFKGCGADPLNVPFGLPQNPVGIPNMMMLPPFPPQRDHSEMEMGMNTRPPIMSREDFETRKADIKRKREIERRDERDFSGDRDFRKEMTSNEDAYSLGPKSKPRPSSSNSHLRRHTGVRPFPPRHCTKRPSPHNTDLSGSSSKYKSSDYKFKDSRHYRSETSARSRASESPYLEKSSVVSTGVSEAETNHKKKAKVFSRISFPEEDSTTKKRKGSSSKHMTEYHDNYKKKVPVKSVSIEVNEESSVDEDRHFKRRRARYD